MTALLIGAVLYGTLMFGTGWFLCDMRRERRAARGREAYETARWERDKERRP